MDTGYAAAYGDLYRHHWWWRTRETILLRRLSGLIGGPAPARILDVGCGAGLFFDALDRFGYVEGIEADATLVEQSARWRDRIRVGELDESFRPEAPFDVILMLDVLEHVPGPEAMLACARRVLAPGGRILITVPAFDWLWTSHDDLNHHLRRYSAEQLRRTIRDAGLVTERVTFLFHSLVLGKLLVRALESVKTGAPDLPQAPSSMINSLLQTWFMSESAFSRWLPFGTSLMAVVRVPDIGSERSL